MQPPSRADLPLPDRPAFEDRFDISGHGLGQAWDVDGGDWTTENGEATQRGTTGLSAARAHTSPLTHAVFEVNLKAEATPVTTGGAIGASP